MKDKDILKNYSEFYFKHLGESLNDLVSLLDETHETMERYKEELVDIKEELSDAYYKMVRYHKALKLIKSKEVNVRLLLDCTDLEEYNNEYDEAYHLDEEEDFKFLKQVLKKEL
jgi:hypothetical protein